MELDLRPDVNPIDLLIDNKWQFRGAVVHPYYVIKNKEKCIDGVDKIVYSGEQELQYLTRIDEDKNVVFWSYKSIVIPYIGAMGCEVFHTPTFHIGYIDNNSK